MRLAFIGNSHSAAVKLGWNALRPSIRDVEIEFFAGNNRMLSGALRLEGRRIVAEPTIKRQFRLTSGGKGAINIDRYDGFALIGMNFGLAQALMVFAKHRSMSTIGSAPYRHLVSETALDLAVRGMVESCQACAVARMIRRVDQEKPIVIASTPLPAAGIVGQKPLFWMDAERLSVRIAPVLETALVDFETTVGVMVQPQPQETIERGCFTKSEFSEGSIRLNASLDVVHPEEDFKHMNPRFGGLVLRDLLTRLGVPA